MADSGVSITDAMEPASRLSQSAEGASVTVALNEIPVDQDQDARVNEGLKLHSAGSVNEGLKSHSAGSVAYDLVERAADCQELDYDEEPQVSEMPGTPASLPSLVSEPEDTCTPVKFLKVSSADYSSDEELSLCRHVAR